MKPWRCLSFKRIFRVYLLLFFALCFLREGVKKQIFYSQADHKRWLPMKWQKLKEHSRDISYITKPPLRSAWPWKNVFLRPPLIRNSKHNSILALIKGAKHRSANSHIDSQYYCVMTRKACQRLVSSPNPLLSKVGSISRHWSNVTLLHLIFSQRRSRSAAKGSCFVFSTCVQFGSDFGTWEMWLGLLLTSQFHVRSFDGMSELDNRGIYWIIENRYLGMQIWRRRKSLIKVIFANEVVVVCNQNNRNGRDI